MESQQRARSTRAADTLATRTLDSVVGTTRLGIHRNRYHPPFPFIFTESNGEVVSWPLPRDSEACLVRRWRWERGSARSPARRPSRGLGAGQRTQQGLVSLLGACLNHQISLGGASEIDTFLDSSLSSSHSILVRKILSLIFSKTGTSQGHTC